MIDLPPHPDLRQVEVLVLSRGKFERLLGSMDDLQQHLGREIQDDCH